MMTLRLLVLTLSAFALIHGSPASQPIYKIKDRDGNIIYTDEKPGPEAEPMELPELGVMGEESDALEDVLQGQTLVDPGVEPLSLVLAQPADGAQITDRGDGVAVVLHSNVDLPPSTQIVLYIDDQPQLPIRQLAVSLDGLAPGAYRLHAELQTPSGRLLTRTETVSFLLQAPPEGALRHE